MLRTAGYRCAVVGKWHLGLGDRVIDWNKQIAPGPAEIGFDESFLIPATGDRVPCVYVENQLVVGIDANDPISVSFEEKVGDDPTGLDNPELLKVKWHHGHNATIVNGISRIGFMSGGKSARWVDEDMADVITTKAVSFIDRHAATYPNQPFFLYFNPHDIHVPRVPHPRFVGATDMGPRGDVIAELDWSVGKLLETLDQHGMNQNTIVILSSDNGPVLNDGYVDEAVERIGEHRPAGQFRGGKYSAFEAGTRVPFLIRWPQRIAATTTSDALVCHVDFLASFAALLNQQLPEGVGPDSLNMSKAFWEADQTGRQHLVEQAGTLALRLGPWKYIPPNKGPAVSPNVNIELGNSADPQLYELTSDPGETKNIAEQNPERVAEMAALLSSIQKNGTPR
jgi:arylsulfatase A-like enzyme